MTKNNGLIHVMTGKDIEEKIEQLNNKKHIE